MKEQVSAFCAEWMGRYDRRLAFYNPETKQLDQQFTLQRYPDYLATQVFTARPGIYMTAQPMADLQHAAMIERLFHDFDNGENPRLALNDAVMFQAAIKDKWDADSLLLYSGSKGYHVHTFLQVPAIGAGYFETDRLYDELMKMALRGGDYPTFDAQVIDIKRQCRMPFSIHQKTGNMCVFVNGDTMPPEPYRPDPGFREKYTAHGVPVDVVEIALKNIRRAKPYIPTPKSTGKNRRLRPCLLGALESKSVKDFNYLTMVEAIMELQQSGVSADEAAEYFRKMDGFDEKTTKDRVKKIYDKKYENKAKCETIAKWGGCLGERCRLYQWLKERGIAPQITGGGSA